jgi:hypothetical protein
VRTDLSPDEVRVRVQTWYGAASLRIAVGYVDLVPLLAMRRRLAARDEVSSVWIEPVAIVLGRLVIVDAWTGPRSACVLLEPDRAHRALAWCGWPVARVGHTVRR